MTDVLAYWRYDNYVKDIEEGAGFHFNSNQKRFHAILNEGDSLWLLTGRNELGKIGLSYYIVARLVVRSKTINSPDYKYGRFRVWGDFEKSQYYRIGLHEASELISHLPFASGR